MKLEIKPMSSYCALSTFRINGIKADYNDFGYTEDIAPDRAEPYGCGNMQFIPDKNPQDGILEKYGITEDEWLRVLKELDCLSFGHCGWCI